MLNYPMTTVKGSHWTIEGYRGLIQLRNYAVVVWEVLRLGAGHVGAMWEV